MSKEKAHIWHNLSAHKTAEILGVDFKKGLNQKQVKEKRKSGKNELPKEKPLPKLAIFINQFKSPLIYILLGAGLVTLLLKETADAIVILGAVFLNTIVGYIQEKKASNTLNELKKVLKVKAIVVREGIEKEILQEEVVVGDLIVLKSGNRVPADARIIKSWNLGTQEAALTGEWLAAKKSAEVLPPGTPLADRDNMVYMGTNVEDGEAIAVVTAIGVKTELGKIARMIKETKEEKTPYQKKLTRFAEIIGLVVGGVCLLIFLEGVLTGKPLIEMFVTSVAVAVAAVPEGLPIAMTVILALGMQRILKRKGLVRKLASAETLGSTSIIATDKTLTLTEGRMEMSVIESDDKKMALRIAALANESFIENPQDKPLQWRIKGGPTDRAKTAGAAVNGVLKPVLEKRFNKIDEIPFSSKNKFIAMLYADKKHPTDSLFVSGAPERIIDLSSKYQGNKKQTHLTLKKISKLGQKLDELTSQGLRVIAVGYKKVKSFKPGEDKLEQEINDLVFVGFICFKDPLRKEAKQAFAICEKAGLRPIIVTGDHLLTAKAVAHELGLGTDKKNLMLGEELDKLSDEQLAKRLREINVFARVEPGHKLRIIDAWQKKKQVVAMTGDGVNDAPALKKADIGVALGSGTDVAKDVSDLVLLDDNFSIIVSAIEEGRAILDNIRKVITYLLASSFTEMILVSAAIIARLPLPVTAVQILWVNLLEDGFPNLALAFEPKEKGLMEQKPSAHNSPLLTKEMKTIIFIIGLFSDLILLGLFFWLYRKFGASQIDYIRTMIFVALTIDSIFYIFACKSLRKSIWQVSIFNNKYLIGAWFLGVLSLIGAIYLPVFQGLLKTVPLAAKDWIILGGLGLLELIMIEIAKHYFIVRHQTES